MYMSHVATANNGINPRRLQKARKIVATIVESLAYRTSDYFRKQRDYRYLLEQPDDLLEDIGLTRSQIVASRRQRIF